MISWSIYSFSLLAIFVIGGRAIPLQFPVLTADPEDSSSGDAISYDYYAEKYLGRYTGPW